MRTLLILAGGVLVVWYVYENYIVPATATAATPTPTPTPVTGSGAPTSGTSGYNSLAAIAARVQGATGPNALYSADQWNYYVNQQSGITMPDPAAVWGSAFDPNARTVNGTLNLTFAQYWGTMSAYLASTMGMSGLQGLGLNGWAV